MKLELKHIANYLPYGLKFKDLGCDDGVDDIATLSQIDLLSNIVADTYGNFDIKFTEIKPLLLPLSALTEQLPDGSVPIVELAKIEAGSFDEDEFKIGKIGEYRYVTNHAAFNNDAHICIYKSGIGRMKQILNYNSGNGFNSYYCFEEDMLDVELRVLNNQLQLFEYLFANHFDVYGLIDAGLAIDKRSCPNTSN